MAIDGNIKSFTALDIEKYHKGQISAKERHDMEKAALDDPFLADALEGYAAVGVNVAEDINELKKRLEKRTTGATVVPLSGRSIPWLRIAAMIILVAGAGFLVYQFGFNSKKETPIAQNEPEVKKQPAPVIIDSSKSGDKSSINNEVIVNKTQDINRESVTEKKETITSRKESANSLTMQKEDTVIEELSGLNTGLVTNTPPETMEDVIKKMPAIKVNRDGTIDKLDTAVNNETELRSNGVMKDKNIASAKKVSNNRSQFIPNIFRGRVLDSNNNALPFANITVTKDNVGTYSDANGYFTLTSPDSVLDVQVHSLGYANINYRLRNDVANNKLVLQEDDPQLSEVVISNRKPNSSRSRTNTTVLEEPEPVDGWENYDTYIANNLNMPETFKTKQPVTGEVELSFEVDKDGNPVNITVEKSLCESCDKEAIRLVKEGPKFKQKKKKKGRTTVTVAF